MDGGVTGVVSGDVQKPQKPGVTGAKPGVSAIPKRVATPHAAFIPYY